MKADIHPEYVADRGHLHLWQHLRHALDRDLRQDPRRRLQRLPPVLHGQAEDPRHRRPRGPVPGALRQEGRQLATSQRRCPARTTALHGSVRAGTGAVSLSEPRVRAATLEGRPTRMSEAFAAAEPLLAEHAQIEAQLADPAVHADAANARKLGRRYAELGQVAQAYTAWKAASRRRRGRRRARGGRRELRRRAAVAAAGRRRRRRAAARGPHPARPRRLPRRDPRGQGGGGRRGVGAVRRGPAADVHAVRREDGLGDAAAGRHGVGPRRLQGRAARDQGARHGRARGRRLGAPEVRGRRAPRAAGAGHGVAGPHPHLRRGRAGVPRGRGRGRGGDRPERPAHRRLPVVGPGRAVGQHHRLRRAHHAPADGHRRVDAEREVAAAEPRGRACACCAPASWPPARRRPRRPRARPAGPRSARSTAPSASGRTTSPRTASPTTARATRPTTSTPCSAATWRPSCSPRSTPTRPRGSRRRCA